MGKHWLRYFLWLLSSLTFFRILLGSSFSPVTSEIGTFPLPQIDKGVATLKSGDFNVMGQWHCYKAVSLPKSSRGSCRKEQNHEGVLGRQPAIEVFPNNLRGKMCPEECNTLFCLPAVLVSLGVLRHRVTSSPQISMFNLLCTPEEHPRLEPLGVAWCRQPARDITSGTVMLSPPLGSLGAFCS